MPCPRGSTPMALCSCSVRPKVMKSMSPPLLPSTPSAPYLAPVISHAETTMRLSTVCMSRSELIATTASSRARALRGRSSRPLVALFVMRPPYKTFTRRSFRFDPSRFPVSQRLQRLSHRRHRGARPVSADPTSSEVAPAQLDVEVTPAPDPRGRVPARPDRAQLVRILDHRGPTDRHNAPALMLLVVEVIDLNGEIGIPAVGAQLAVRHGAEDDRVIAHRVVQRHDPRAHRCAHRHPTHDAAVEQVNALLDAQFHRFVHDHASSYDFHLASGALAQTGAISPGAMVPFALIRIARTGEAVSY